MANGWNSDSDREAMLRRVAIVLSSFPASVANRLLGTMGEESKQAVRRTMTRLSDVDPLERQRALQAFRVSIQQQPSAESSAGEVASEATSRVMSSASVAVNRRPANPLESSPPESNRPESNRTVSDSPLEFLSDVDDDTLLALLTVEHPQAIALVLASIAPAQAARILPRLPSRLRGETLSRLGRLGEIPEAAAAEVADHFRSRLAGFHRGGNRANGKRALDAILAAMPSDVPVEDLAPDATPGQPRTDQPDGSASVDFPSSDRAAIDLTTKLRQSVETGDSNQHPVANEPSVEHPLPPETQPNLRVVSGDPSNEDRTNNVDRAIAESMTPTTSRSFEASVLSSTDSIHQYLVALTPMELCKALGKVETRDAMLALCGLPNSVSEAALSVLPRAQAKKVRLSMNGLGSLQLREIDEAKERVAQASIAASDMAVESFPMAA